MASGSYEPIHISTPTERYITVLSGTWWIGTETIRPGQHAIRLPPEPTLWMSRAEFTMTAQRIPNVSSNLRNGPHDHHGRRGQVSRVFRGARSQRAMSRLFRHWFSRMASASGSVPTRHVKCVRYASTGFEAGSH